MTLGRYAEMMIFEMEEIITILIEVVRAISKQGFLLRAARCMPSPRPQWSLTKGDVHLFESLIPVGWKVVKFMQLSNASEQLRASYAGCKVRANAFCQCLNNIVAQVIVSP